MSAERNGMGLPYYLYNGALVLFAPAIAGAMAWRMRVKGKSREGWQERLGRYPDGVRRLGEADDPVLWMHAVSVGEVAAAEAILGEVRRMAPLTRVVLSTTTPTGRALARKRDLRVDALVYLPFDLPWIVRRALDTIRPDLLVTIDTELWPNLFALAHARGTRTAVANARFSDRAFGRARTVRPIYAWTLSNVDAVLAQSELDAKRYRAMGASPDRVRVTGSAKFDEDFPQVSDAEIAKLRQDLCLSANLPIWVVGSTREGEDEMMLDAFREIRIKQSELQLVIAPRHPERGDQIEALVRGRGYHPLRRSQMLAAAPSSGPPGPHECPQDTVVILDTIGELAKVYALADVVVVGGSFIKWGGHNMLQPMAHGKPVIVGPHTHNFRDIVSICEAEQALLQLSGPEELADAVGRLLSTQAEADLLSVRALKVVRANKGASERAARRLAELLSPP